MYTNRRKFLTHTSALTASALTGALGNWGIRSAEAQGVTGYKALVGIFMFGGADSNNKIVPNDAARFTQYSTVRAPAVGLTQAQLLPFTTTTQAAGNNSYGFHPSFAPIVPLYTAKKLAVIANAGTLIAPITMAQYKAGVSRPPNLFSHSDQQALWQGLLPGQVIRSGWGGRFADKLMIVNSGAAIPTMVSVSGTQVFNQGLATTPFVIPSAGGVLLSGQAADAVSMARFNALRALLGTGGSNQIVNAAASTLDGALDAATAANPFLTGTIPTVITNAFVNPANPAQQLNSGIANQLKQVARLIEGRAALGIKRQVYLVNIGGWDTHSNVLTNEKNLLDQLVPAMKAFYDYTVAAGLANDVTQFTMSDFNRTFVTNQSLGTDHAWGGHHFVLGGSVKGGDMYGTFPTLMLGNQKAPLPSGPDDTGSNGAWLPTTAVDQIASTLALWFGASASDLTYIFPNLKNFAGKENLGFMG